MVRGARGAPPSLRLPGRLVAVRLDGLGLLETVLESVLESIAVYLFLLLGEVDGVRLPGQVPAEQGYQGGQQLLPETVRPHLLAQPGLLKGHGTKQVSHLSRLRLQGEQDRARD